MRSKIIVALLTIVGACSEGNPSGNTPRVGSVLVKSVTDFSASNSSGSKNNTAIILNERYNQVLEVAIDPFEVIAKHDIPAEIEAERLLVGPEGRYFLVVGKENFAIVRSDGAVDVNPLEFFGAIRSAAFDGARGRLVVLDDFDTLGLLELDRNGKVKRSWAGGPLIADDIAVVAGALLPSGPLVISCSDGQIALVDFEKSIGRRKWSFDLFDPEIETPQVEEEDEQDPSTADLITGLPYNGFTQEKTPSKDRGKQRLIWLSPIGNDTHVLARTANQVLLIDTSRQEVIESVTPTKIIGHFDQAVGHVISEEGNSGLFKVYWGVGDELKEQTVKFAPAKERSGRLIEYLSILNPEKNAVSITHGPEGNYETVYRFRLSDSMVISVNDTPVKEVYDVYQLNKRKAEMVVSEDHLIYLHYNSLGRIERRSLGKKLDPLIIKGFNLEEARRSW